ncbi:MAG: hypothetical protein ACI8VC_001782 [Candidatus Endobugula sp.]|jgi:hypothetical protein
MGYTVVYIQIAVVMCIHPLGLYLLDDGLKRLHHIEQRYTVHTVIPKIQRIPLRNPKNTHSLIACLVTTLKFFFHLAISTRLNAIGHEHHMYNIALGDMPRDRPTAAEHFVVGVSGYDKNCVIQRIAPN